MPEISRFFGVIIRMFAEPDEQRLVEAWAELHQGELVANWKRLQSGRAPYKIAPLR